MQGNPRRVADRQRVWLAFSPNQALQSSDTRKPIVPAIPAKPTGRTKPGHAQTAARPPRPVEQFDLWMLLRVLRNPAKRSHRVRPRPSPGPRRGNDRPNKGVAKAREHARIITGWTLPTTPARWPIRAQRPTYARDFAGPTTDPTSMPQAAPYCRMDPKGGGQGMEERSEHDPREPGQVRVQNSHVRLERLNYHIPQTQLPPLIRMARRRAVRNRRFASRNCEFSPSTLWLVAKSRSRCRLRL